MTNDMSVIGLILTAGITSTTRSLACYSLVDLPFLMLVQVNMPPRTYLSKNYSMKTSFRHLWLHRRRSRGAVRPLAPAWGLLPLLPQPQRPRLQRAGPRGIWADSGRHRTRGPARQIQVPAISIHIVLPGAYTVSCIIHHAWM
jgi:hypothetical protein